MPPASPSPSGGAGSSLYPTRGERVGVRGNYPGQRSRLVDGEALVGVEDPALDIGGLGGPPPELVHAAHQAHPIQDLLLAAVLDGTQRPLPPRAWRERPLSAIEDSGQQEVLNWMCLMGGMNELGRRPSETSYVESWIFNSNKCFAVYQP